jgi:hypothetical protein
MRGFFPLCHAISLLQALWHSRLYMTTAIGGGSLSLNKNYHINPIDIILLECHMFYRYTILT